MLALPSLRFSTLTLHLAKQNHQTLLEHFLGIFAENNFFQRKFCKGNYSASSGNLRRRATWILMVMGPFILVGPSLLGYMVMHKPRAPNSTPPFRPIVPPTGTYNYNLAK